jgi:hypothetical protein
MLRNRKVLVLLLAAAVPATAQSFGFSIGTIGPAACLAIGETAYRVAANGAHADYTVLIDPAAPAPDLRLQMSETADVADFVFVDDGDAPARCPHGASGIKSVAVGTAAPAPDLVVGFATSTLPPDYRIFVRSRFLQPETAAALFAAAHIQGRVLMGKVAANRSN